VARYKHTVVSEVLFAYIIMANDAMIEAVPLKLLYILTRRNYVTLQTTAVLTVTAV